MKKSKNLKLKGNNLLIQNSEKKIDILRVDGFCFAKISNILQD